MDSLGLAIAIRLLSMGIILAAIPADHVWMKMVLLVLSDSMDCKSLQLMEWENRDLVCSTYQYAVADKILDLLTYFIMTWLGHRYIPGFSLEFYLALIVYRAIGVMTFVHTRQVMWLVVFPDLFKECLLAGYISAGDGNVISPSPAVFAIIYVLKTAFEYYFHRYHHTLGLEKSGYEF